MSFQRQISLQQSLSTQWWMASDIRKIGPTRRIYYRFVEQPYCAARITLTDGVLSSCLPTHTHHSQEADIAVRRTLEAELSHSPDKRRTEYRLPLLPWSTSLFPHPTHREKTCCCGITPTLTSFGSIDNHLLSRASHLMMDGTFSTLPQLCNIKL